MVVHFVCLEDDQKYFDDYLQAVIGVLTLAGVRARVTTYNKVVPLDTALSAVDESVDTVIFTNVAPDTWAARKHMVLNMEQLSARHNMTSSLLHRKYPILDYSYANVRYSGCGHVLPYPLLDEEVEKLTGFAGVEKEYDVAFVSPGPSDRRQRMLKLLRDARIDVREVKGFGDARDAEIGKARILLNVHFSSEYRIFEAIRCDRWIAAGLPVVTEISDPDDDALAALAIQSRYDELPYVVGDVLDHYDQVVERIREQLPRLLAQEKRERHVCVDIFAKEDVAHRVLSPSEETLQGYYDRDFGGLVKHKERLRLLRCGLQENVTIRAAPKTVINIYCNVNQAPAGDDALCSRALSQAIDAWSVCVPCILYQTTEEPDRADFIFEWKQELPSRSAPVFAQFSADCRVAYLDKRLHYLHDTREYRTEHQVDLCAVMCHCIGHWLGFPYSADVDNVMHPVLSLSGKPMRPKPVDYPGNSDVSYSVRLVGIDADGRVLEGVKAIGQSGAWSSCLAQFGLQVPREPGFDIVYQIQDDEGVWHDPCFSNTLTRPVKKIASFRMYLEGPDSKKVRLFYKAHLQNQGDVVGTEHTVIKVHHGIERLEAVVVRDDKRLAYVSGATGYDPVNLRVPRRPDINSHAFYFSDNDAMRAPALDAGWTFVRMEHEAPVDDAIASNMRCKVPKVYPLSYPGLLEDYEYIVWGDSKGDINERTVERNIRHMENDPLKVLMLAKHRFLRGGPRKEMEMAVAGAERYARQQFKMRDYLESVKHEGVDVESFVHYECGFLLWNAQHHACSEVQEAWLTEIEKCGIDDQVTLPIIAQRYPKYVKLLDGWMGSIGHYSTFRSGVDSCIILN